MNEAKELPCAVSDSGVPASFGLCGIVLGFGSGKFGYVTIISEWGTPSLGCAGHQWPHAWSYGSYDPKTGKTMDFLAYYNKHKDTAMLPDITPDAKLWLNKQVGDFFAEFLRQTSQTGRSGQFYCQLVDVETECDGLISYDRVVPKVDAQKIAEVIRASMPKLRPA